MKPVNALSEAAVFVSMCAFSLGCTGAGAEASPTVRAEGDRAPDPAKCKPESQDHEVLKKAQLACHRGVQGDAVHVLITKTWGHVAHLSDSERRELISIYFDPRTTTKTEVAFRAFYSSGEYELRGKSGCIGILESGKVNVKVVGLTREVRYSLRFRLKSPLGWKDECDDAIERTGLVKI